MVVWRFKEKQFFSEEEVWAMADQLISSLRFLESQDASCGDLRPGAIYVQGG
jgi:hypothetical protein